MLSVSSSNSRFIYVIGGFDGKALNYC